MATSRRKRLTLIHAAPTSTSAYVTRLAHRLYGPGYNAESGLLTGDGTAKTYSATFVNESGAAIDTASIVLQGWYLTATGTTNTGNTYDVTGTIEYPVGTTTTQITSGGSTIVTVPTGSHIKTDDVVLSATIPAGASFKVNLSSTVPNASKYIIRLGFAGLLTKVRKGAARKIALYAIGDSIATNNGGSVYNAALSKCPAYHASIIGTTAATYGATSAANLMKQAALSATLGITHMISNFGTNDFGAATSLATLQGYLNSMKTLVNSVGVKFVQTTMLPRTGTTAAVTVSSMTSSGNVMTASVPDASRFIVGKPYVVAGATQTEYNGSKMCLAVDTTGNTVNFLFIGSGTTPATGTITVNQWKQSYSVSFMTSMSSFFDAGSGSPRGQFNAWVRGGAFDDYIEWADAVEPSRDSGRWLVGGEHALLPDVQLITVSSIINTSRFNSNYSAGSSTISNGFVQPYTGSNAGDSKSGNGNTNGDVTVSSAWTNTQVIGDQYYAVPGVSYISDDGTHPRVAGGGKGGQALLDAATLAKINAWLV
jgi:hypothetical protein